MLRGDEMAAAFGMAAHQDATPSHIRLLFCPLRCSHAGDLSCKEPGWKLCGWAFSNFPSYSELNSWMLTHGFSLVIYAHDRISTSQPYIYILFFSQSPLPCLSTGALSNPHLQLMLYGVISRIISRRGMNTLAHDENGEPTLQTRNMSVQRESELCSRARPEAGATDGYRFSVLKRPMRNRSLANIMDLG
ncbi:uncharacterized protein [Lolium perenne]|uniref:uncharacterized protein isoform X3 n=1 Tax=Lolium perenne TaxID=4522 RepID=UPI003A99E32C